MIATEIKSAVLGIIQGYRMVISSTGHMILADNLLN